MDFQLSAFADEAGGKLTEQIAAMRDNHIPYLEIRGVDGENIAARLIGECRKLKVHINPPWLVQTCGYPAGRRKNKSGVLRAFFFLHLSIKETDLHCNCRFGDFIL